MQKDIIKTYGLNRDTSIIHVYHVIERWSYREVSMATCWQCRDDNPELYHKNYCVLETTTGLSVNPLLSADMCLKFNMTRNKGERQKDWLKRVAMHTLDYMESEGYNITQHIQKSKSILA